MAQTLVLSRCSKGRRWACKEIFRSWVWLRGDTCGLQHGQLFSPGEKPGSRQPAPAMLHLVRYGSGVSPFIFTVFQLWWDFTDPRWEGLLGDAGIAEKLSVGQKDYPVWCVLESLVILEKGQAVNRWEECQDLKMAREMGAGANLTGGNLRVSKPNTPTLHAEGERLAVGRGD